MTEARSLVKAFEKAEKQITGTDPASLELKATIRQRSKASKVMITERKPVAEQILVQAKRLEAAEEARDKAKERIAKDQAVLEAKTKEIASIEEILVNLREIEAAEAQEDLEAMSVASREDSAVKVGAVPARLSPASVSTSASSVQSALKAMQPQNEELQRNMMASMQAQIAAALAQIQIATGVPVLQAAPQTSGPPLPAQPPLPSTFVHPIVPPISVAPLAPRSQSPEHVAPAAATPTDGDGCQPTAIDAGTQGDEHMCLSARSSDSQDEGGSAANTAARKVGFRAVATRASKRRADAEITKTGPRPTIGKGAKDGATE